jgi:hypothetical protein
MSLIKANELRIGNYLKLVGPSWTTQQRGIIQRISASDIVDIEFTGGDAYQPIPLNKELLLQCGFTYSTDTELELSIDESNKLVANPYIERGYAVQLCCQTNWAGQKPLYLHQLQNLYYVLTGEELNVESEKNTNDRPTVNPD